MKKVEWAEKIFGFTYQSFMLPRLIVIIPSTTKSSRVVGLCVAMSGHVAVWLDFLLLWLALLRLWLGIKWQSGWPLCGYVWASSGRVVGPCVAMSGHQVAEW